MFTVVYYTKPATYGDTVIFDSLLPQYEYST